MGTISDTTSKEWEEEGVRMVENEERPSETIFTFQLHSDSIQKPSQFEVAELY